MISLIHSINAIVNLFLIIMGAIALPSALIGCLSIAAQRHRQGQQNLATPVQIVEAKTPQELQTETTPEPKQTLFPSTTDIDADAYSGIDPLGPETELQETAQVKPTLPAAPKTQTAEPIQTERPKITPTKISSGKTAKQTAQIKPKNLSPLAAFLVDSYGSPEKTPETSQ